MFKSRHSIALGTKSFRYRIDKAFKSVTSCCSLTEYEYECGQVRKLTIIGDFIIKAECSRFEFAKASIHPGFELQRFFPYCFI